MGTTCGNKLPIVLREPYWICSLSLGFAKSVVAICTESGRSDVGLCKWIQQSKGSNAVMAPCFTEYGSLDTVLVLKYVTPFPFECSIFDAWLSMAVK